MGKRWKLRRGLRRRDYEFLLQLALLLDFATGIGNGRSEAYLMRFGKHNAVAAEKSVLFFFPLAMKWIARCRDSKSAKNGMKQQNDTKHKLEVNRKQSNNSLLLASSPFFFFSWCVFCTHVASLSHHLSYFSYSMSHCRALSFLEALHFVCIFPAGEKEGG